MQWTWNVQEMRQWETMVRESLPLARWFRSKTRSIRSLRWLEHIPLPLEGSDESCVLSLVEVNFSEGAPEVYSIPFSSSGGLAWSQALLRAWLCQKVLPGERGALYPHGQIPQRNIPWCEPIRAGEDSSNTSVVFAGQCFLKLYRLVEAGPHPEVESGMHLNAAGGWPYSARLFGGWVYRTGGQEFHVAVMQECLNSEGNAWEYMQSRMDGATDLQIPVGLLAQRTAQLHLRLSDGVGDFSPTPLDDKYLDRLFSSVGEQARVLSQKVCGFHRELALLCTQAEHWTLEIRRKGRIAAQGGARIRIHGDLHLGQVLCRAKDFVFVDFEGEPARPLQSRREKHSPLKDVAGMLRSLDYAAGLGGALRMQKAQALAEVFWQGYWQLAEGSGLLPRTQEACHVLLQLFLMEKVLYEIAYELENRPDWLAIPIRGLRHMLKTHG